ncbi:MAG: lamin tail domain-containing protein [Planctomycetota bacterium]|nr:lamin tail domain-containing protein [Planctomycetota bacterium]
MVVHRGKSLGKDGKSFARLRHSTGRSTCQLELLEPRQLLAVTPVISEFMAENTRTLKDVDGKYSDWIEIYNPDTKAVDLTGYYLTNHLPNDPQAPPMWKFPSTSLAAGSYLVVFASGEGRAVPGQQLHTDFKLDPTGEYLGLVAADGSTIVSQYAPKYPQQQADISYGRTVDQIITRLVSTAATAKILIPTSGALGLTWTDIAFDDSAWINGKTGVGYETEPPAPQISGFTSKMIDTSTANIYNIAIAESILNGGVPAGSIISTKDVPVVNFCSDSGGQFGGDLTLPNGAGVGDNMNIPQREQYAVRSTANVVIPAGQWTINGNTDDGFLLKIPGVTFLTRINDEYSGATNPSPSDTLVYGATRGTANTLATFNVPDGGLRTTIQFDFYECGGGDEAELSIAQGYRSGFDLSSFRLLSDGLLGWSVKTTSSTPPPNYSDLIGTDVKSQMTNSNSAYIRIPFAVGDTPNFDVLKLRVKYDDGFVAYLNGTPIASRNVPKTPLWNSSATATHPDAQALNYEDIDITQYMNLLRVGNNVLAIHALNKSDDRADFLIYPEVQGIDNLLNVDRYFTAPTPGKANDPSSLSTIVADTKFDHDRGYYSSPFDLTITCATDSAQIRYTTDGTVPTATSGFLYTNPIHIASTTSIRAAAFATGFLPANSDTQTYLFIDDIIRQSPNHETPTTSPDWPKQGYLNGQIIDYGMDQRVVNNPSYSTTVKTGLTSIPTFSITLDLKDMFDPGTGFYVNPWGSGRNWERQASIELIYPDGTQGFQINGGVRVRGGFSRTGENPKHGFRFFFRDDPGYGGKLKFPMFGPDGAQEFQLFDLRCGQNYSWSFGGDPSQISIRDQVSRDLQIAMGQPGAHGQFYQLFINGQYWGLYNTDERPSASNSANLHGGSSSDYDVIKMDPEIGYNIEAVDGNINAWADLWNQARGDMTSLANYMKLQGKNPDGSRNPSYAPLLDVDDLIDYMLDIYYTGNLDAPLSAFLGNKGPNNFYAIYNRAGTENPGVTPGFKFYVHDAEHTFLNVNENRIGPAAGQYWWVMGTPTAGNVTANGSTITVYLPGHPFASGDAMELFGASQSQYNGTYSVNVTDANTFTYTVPTAPSVTTATGNIRVSWPFGRSNPQLVFELLAASPEFRQRVGDRIQKFFYNDGTLTANAVKAIFNKRKAEIDTAIVDDSARWGDSKSPNYPLTRANWLNEINRILTSYIPQRSGIVLSQLKANNLYPTLQAPKYNQNGGVIPSGFTLTITNPNSSSTLYYTTDGSDPRLPGGAIAPGANTYSASIPITATTRVQARVLSTNGKWSALIDYTFTFDASALRITELMYNPAPPPDSSPFKDFDFEFIELQNTASEPIDLFGIQFTSGIEFVFDNTTLDAADQYLAPGQRIVVAKNKDAFLSRYASTIHLTGPYDGKLNNAGDTIRLQGPLDQVVEEFTYNNTWYPITDGQGFSLIALNPLATNAVLSTNDGWRPSYFPNGAPGDADPGLDHDALIVNEVLTHTDQPTGDWIELYNTTNNDVDISGWFLSDSSLDLRKYQINSSPKTILRSHQYIVFNFRDHFGNPGDPGSKTQFALNELGDDVFLSSSYQAPNAQWQLAGYRESVGFDDADKEVTLGRYNKSTGGHDFVELAAPTPGVLNALSLVGPVVINEIMYHPATGKDEYIELKNITGSPVTFYDLEHPENAWKFVGGIDFTFKNGDQIAAYGYALIVPIDPATFRTKYSIPNSIPIFGPFTGSLVDAGDSIELIRPGQPDVNSTDLPYYRADRVTYAAASPWPTAPNGSGPSLARIAPTLYGNDVINWTAEKSGGSPGRGNIDLLPPNVRILPVDPDPLDTSLSSITIIFDEPVNGFDLPDLKFTREGASTNLLTSSQTLTDTGDGQSFLLSNLDGITWRAETYTLTLTATGSSISDLANNLLVTNATQTFTLTTTTINGLPTAANAFIIKTLGDSILIFVNVPTSAKPTYIISNSEVSALTINGGTADDVLTIQSTLSFSPLFNAGPGNNRLSLTAGDYTFNSDANGLNITLSGQARLSLNNAQHLGQLSLSGSASAAVAPDGNLPLQVAGLTLGVNASLDLADNSLIVHPTDPATLPAVYSQIAALVKSGRSSSSTLWQGAGINTSRATDSTGLATALKDNSVHVKYTWNGDANLDGLVNADDYFLIDSAFISQAKGFYNGDFNYDDIINADDYFLIDSAFISQTGPLSAIALTAIDTPYPSPFASASSPATPRPYEDLFSINTIASSDQSLLDW